ncbi:GNAT family N-acetyltransferase [Actinoplanes hulinensis]|uniref:GNAT family N-acetyltransferase n=1 Tax=Actinoplanes hulinensis TaxID=1144547 RepID=A0ABS7BGL6_9ACTN|nr:GNAT family N-acetyltransferase [Actinoplanes hulinensis]MBW6440033.1 GNAT family N-acetyltransferase [Actinoplanes hulinensis]
MKDWEQRTYAGVYKVPGAAGSTSITVMMPQNRFYSMPPALHTERLALNTFTEDDAAELHELFADPRTHTTGSGPFTALAQTTRWIANRVATQRDHGLCWYALRRTDTDQLIGNCGLFPGRTGYAEPEIGYLIAEEHRGLGYAAEAVAAVLRHCRAAGLRRVWASIRPRNAASLRVAESAGMGLDHVETDERGDLLLYVIDLAPATTG